MLFLGLTAFSKGTQNLLILNTVAQEKGVPEVKILEPNMAIALELS